MTSNTSRANTSPPRQSLLVLAWVVTLLVSFLPNIIWQETTGQQPDWLLWAKVILLAILILLSFISKVIQPLRHYFVLVAVLYLATELAQWIELTTLWQRWFGGSGSFSVEMLGAQILRLATALVMIGGLLVLGYRRREFFLAKGELDAPAEREQWLGMKEPEPWTEFGRSFAIVITLVTLIFLVIAGRPSLRALGQLLPLLPMVLLLAAMNAFSEETSYRAALLAPLHNVVGKQHAVFLTAVFFLDFG
jgi:hypothetical protein